MHLLSTSPIRSFMIARLDIAIKHLLPGRRKFYASLNVPRRSEENVHTLVHIHIHTPSLLAFLVLEVRPKACELGQLLPALKTRSMQYADRSKPERRYGSIRLFSFSLSLSAG